MRKALLSLSLTFAFLLPAAAQQQDAMRVTVEYLASPALGGRFPSTAGDTLASDYLAGKLRSLRLKPVVREKKNKGFYQDFTFGKTEQKTSHNIIAVLPGKDRQLRNEYIVVGAHYDHLGLGGEGSGSRRPDTVAVHPGADDNASGDAVVLQLARHFKRERPARSIVFVFFGAEEQGIVGSKSGVYFLSVFSEQLVYGKISKVLRYLELCSYTINISVPENVNNDSEFPTSIVVPIIWYINITLKKICLSVGGQLPLEIILRCPGKVKIGAE